MPRRITWALASLLLLLLIPAGRARAEDEAPTKPLQPELKDAERVVERNLLLRMGAKHVGGSRMRLGFFADGSVLEVSEQRAGFRTDVAGVSTLQFEATYRTYYDAQRRRVWHDEKEVSKGVVTTSHTRYTPTKLHVRYASPQLTYEETFDRPADHADTQGIVWELRKRGELKAGVERTYSVFDKEERKFSSRTIKVLGARTVKFAGKEVVGTAILSRRKGRDSITVFDQDGAEIERRMGEVLATKLVEGDPFPSGNDADVVRSTIVLRGAAPRALQLEEMQLAVRIKTASEAAHGLFKNSRYQTIVQRAGALLVTLKSTKGDTSRGEDRLPLAEVPAEVATYLKPSPLCQSDDPKIIAQSKLVVADGATALAAVTQIVRWVYKNLGKRKGVRGTASAVETLEAGFGDCTEHTALTVALCRSLGIPARQVAGIEYLGEYKTGAFMGYHAWGEVWLGRWIAVDATIPEVGTSARYLAFERTKEEDELPLRAVTTAAFGEPEIDILAYRHKGQTERVSADWYLRPPRTAEAGAAVVCRAMLSGRSAELDPVVDWQTMYADLKKRWPADSPTEPPPLEAFRAQSGRRWDERLPKNTPAKADFLTETVRGGMKFVTHSETRVDVTLPAPFSLVFHMVRQADGVWKAGALRGRR